MILPKMPEDWEKVLLPYLPKNYFEKMETKIQQALEAHQIIYPPAFQVFRAFELTPFEKVKVLLMGQDPYHGPREACGLSFSVEEGVKAPPSLRNILKELHSDLGYKAPSSDLSGWAKEGVLLLNRALTVQKDQPLSCQDWGWDYLSKAVIQALMDRNKPLVFLALGQKSYALLEPHRNQFKKGQTLVVTKHPSPFSAHSGFFGSKIFSTVNHALAESGVEPVDFTAFPATCLSNFI